MYIVSGFIQLQVRQNGQQILVAFEQILFGENQTFQERSPSNGKYYLLLYACVRLCIATLLAPTPFILAVKL